MTERERLIELLDKKYDHFCDQCGVNKDSHYTDSLADYLLANGVIVPPCKIGDKVYFVQSGRIKLLEVHNITYSFKYRDYYVYFKNDDGSASNIHYNQFIGYKLFLTKEEAEDALRKEDEGK